MSEPDYSIMAAQKDKLKGEVRKNDLSSQLGRLEQFIQNFPMHIQKDARLTEGIDQDIYSAHSTNPIPDTK
jgi:hypothetical protein